MQIPFAIITLGILADLILSIRYLHQENQHSIIHSTNSKYVNASTAKLFNLNFYLVSRWRDPQLQVSGNYLGLPKWGSTIFKSCWLVSRFIFNMSESWYLIR